MSWTRRKLLCWLGLGGAAAVVAAPPKKAQGHTVQNVGLIQQGTVYTAEQDLLVVGMIEANDPNGFGLIIGEVRHQGEFHRRGTASVTIDSPVNSFLMPVAQGERFRVMQRPKAGPATCHVLKTGPAVPQ